MELFDCFRSIVVDPHKMLAKNLLQTLQEPLCKYLKDIDDKERSIINTEANLDDVRTGIELADFIGLGTGVFCQVGGTLLAGFLKICNQISFGKTIKIVIITSVTLGVSTTLFLRRWMSATNKGKKIQKIRIKRLLDKIKDIDEEISSNKHLNVSYTDDDLKSQIIPSRNAFQEVVNLYQRIDKNSSDTFYYTYGPSGPVSFNLDIPAIDIYHTINDYTDLSGIRHETIRHEHIPERHHHEIYLSGYRPFNMYKSKTNPHLKN